MSYPPRQPMGMPSMPPGMMPPGYGYGMGMMPMNMGMMGMMRPGMPMPPNPAANQNNTMKQNQKKLVPQEIPNSTGQEEKPPVTTVFVGNISERAPDAMVRQMLSRCGNVISWKRVQGASGKLQAFGFCEYEYPEATLRCIRLLNEWAICGKKLVVKVDAKTKTLLEEYKEKKKNSSKEEKEEGETTDDVDEFSQREDRVAKAGLDAIMREYARELNKEPEPSVKPEEKKEDIKKKDLKEKDKKKADQGLEDLEMEDDKKDLINKEINKFRDLHKDEEDKSSTKDEGDYDRERRRRERERERERARERDKKRREREMEEREREREKERTMSRRRSRSRSNSRSRARSYERSYERSRSRERGGGDEEVEDEEEVYERRKLERKLREKEMAYQERLKNWEARERKKAREYEKEKEKEEERKIEEVKEARRLKEFLEDYDDERDDPKYYRGSALQRRLKEREKEMEADARDRQREKEELEEIRKKLLEEGHPNPEEELAKLERESVEHLRPPPAPVAPVKVEPEPEPEPEPVKYVQPPKLPPTFKPVEIATSAASSQSSPAYSDGYSNTGLPESAHEDSPSVPFIGPAPKEESSRIGFTGLKLGADSSPDSVQAKRKKLTVGDVFNQEDDEDSMGGAKRRKLVPLDYSEDEKAAVGGDKPATIEEKRKNIKNLIDRIPTGKEELFAFTLDWNMVDKVLMEKRIKPWVNKKIIEYIGEEEPTLTEFICQKVMSHSQPSSILGDVAMVLDEEAEVFVVKMWRLLIYETEAKKAGLVK
ncbi:RNA-binding protein 25 isoform X3 [Lingula anatina]|uniref:RNA-binding protein 25 isoform X1 n=1 Tax=Lingula anatina TaxID=7574 RepID=A0A1S3IPQ7_LINAN|nr:RNA-binding protein 25 isoform X1 [Lingula anatina]XP_013400053.1 RNA-binding protein 25 isoform X2 [Lingula anatina]XP_013400054.1 RNA-binding protein 25 isoform X3 [Lingula anatina]|eukprot:XP_013400052.1 RNA-binding protein 25 isoform X1 [Lingula anatina]